VNVQGGDEPYTSSSSDEEGDIVQEEVVTRTTRRNSRMLVSAEARSIRRMSKLNRIAKNWEGSWEEGEDDGEEEEDDERTNEEYSKQRQIAQQEAILQFESNIENFKSTISQGLDCSVWEPNAKISNHRCRVTLQNPPHSFQSDRTSQEGKQQQQQQQHHRNRSSEEYKIPTLAFESEHTPSDLAQTFLQKILGKGSSTRVEGLKLPEILEIHPGHLNLPEVLENRNLRPVEQGTGREEVEESRFLSIISVPTPSQLGRTIIIQVSNREVRNSILNGLRSLVNEVIHHDPDEIDQAIERRMSDQTHHHHSPRRQPTRGGERKGQGSASHLERLTRKQKQAEDYEEMEVNDNSASDYSDSDSSGIEDIFVHLSEVKRQLRLERMNYERVMAQMLDLTNDLTMREEEIHKLRRQVNELSEAQQQKERRYEQDAEIRMKLGKRLEQVLMEKEELKEELRAYQASHKKFQR
jgi:hypothetical protein